MAIGTIMRAAVVAVVLAGTVGTNAAAAPSDGSVVRAWSDLSFAAVRTGNLSDAQAARLYAMVDGAMYDAVNATAGAP
ncbi:MAG: hypothetical protein QOF76_3236, partial [Solirubrobacteraceae bacterium]|nr:hypothetical protein [Solirubrobacteraceae bacterium]